MCSEFQVMRHGGSGFPGSSWGFRIQMSRSALRMASGITGTSEYRLWTSTQRRLGCVSNSFASLFWGTPAKEPIPTLKPLGLTRGRPLAPLRFFSDDPKPKAVQVADSSLIISTVDTVRHTATLAAWLEELQGQTLRLCLNQVLIGRTWEKRSRRFRAWPARVLRV